MRMARLSPGNDARLISYLLACGGDHNTRGGQNLVVVLAFGVRAHTRIHAYTQKTYIYQEGRAEFSHEYHGR